MDVHSPEQRSKNMAAIKSKATKAEVMLGKAMWKEGLRYRKNDKTVFGKPDFTFKKKKIAIFVDSEFFHGKDWETKKRPATNSEFWEKKILRNIERDREVNRKLIEEDWRVLRFWSKEVLTDLKEILSEIEAEFKAIS